MTVGPNSIYKTMAGDINKHGNSINYNSMNTDIVNGKVINVT